MKFSWRCGGEILSPNSVAVLTLGAFVDLDIQRCLMIAKEMSAATPKSATYRMHARAVGFANVQECGDTESSREVGSVARIGLSYRRVLGSST